MNDFSIAFSFTAEVTDVLHFLLLIEGLLSRTFRRLSWYPQIYWIPPKNWGC